MTTFTPVVSRARYFSYAFLALVMVLVAWLHLTTPLLSALFSYFALRKLNFTRRAHDWLAVVLFLMLVAIIAYGLIFFVKDTMRGLPDVVDKAVPSLITLAQRYEVEVPFTDYDSLRGWVMDVVKDQNQYWVLATRARNATAQVVFLLVGVVVAISLFFNTRAELDRRFGSAPGNLYSLCCDEIGARFAAFYESFATVMGAQLAISAINTALTTVFVLAMGMPHPILIIGVTFLCGLLPVVGNLISNVIICCIGLTVSPKLALIALIFLILIHKLEYFLNSRIIGARIRNPVWLMLLSLVLGERLMGLPGMILAPVVLYYLKMEASQIGLVAPPGSCAAGTDDAKTPPMV